MAEASKLQFAVESDDALAETNGLIVRSLRFAYSGSKPLIDNFSLSIPPGSRVLLAGANGAGKTTLLSVLAGKHMIDRDMVRVLGRPPFHDTDLTCQGELSYLGSNWRRNVSFAGFDVPLQGDFPAGKMIYGVEGVDPARRDRLIRMLDIDPTWSMMKVSDGQRRRVQICLGLLKPYSVLLCDEITVDLDVIGRLDLLRFFREECEERGAIVVYATHIFDGIEGWFSHLAYVENGTLVRGGLASSFPELDAVNGKRHKLLPLMEKWLKVERDERKERERVQKTQPPVIRKSPFDGMPSKQMAFYR